MECVVCYEPFKPEETALPCGHWIHIECVQKSADAMQDIRAQDGYPPIKDCTCPVCKKPVQGIKPKAPPPVSVGHIFIERTLIYSAFTAWEELNNPNIPLSFFIWTALCGRYPEHTNAEELMTAAVEFERLINTGLIRPPQRDNRFREILELTW